MKTILLSLSMLTLLFPTLARAAFYQWTDANGVVHLTDDRDKIPKQYQDKAKRSDLPDREPSAAPPAARATPQTAAPKPYAPGGHDEMWWRERFRGLRTQLEGLQRDRTQKEQQLVELRRKRTIFQRARDREAVNAMQAGISADDAKISEMLNRIAALELAASQAGVPVEWRQ